MEKSYVISIAGFDPSAGAGVLADVKTFEAFSLDGMGVCSAITAQNDEACFSVRYLPYEEIVAQLEPLIAGYSIAGIKIGLIESFSVLQKILTYLDEKNILAPIIWDPVLSASSGPVFHSSINAAEVTAILDRVLCSTPNGEEYERLKACYRDNHNVYVTSYTETEREVIDRCFVEREESFLASLKIEGHQTHGSGCVFSSALLAGYIKEKSLFGGAELARTYVRRYIGARDSMRGEHFYGEHTK